MLSLFAPLILSIQLGRAAEVPFWKAKPKVYERIQNGEVIVSVREAGGDGQTPRHQLLLNGGGHVNAPCDFVYATALKFEEIARLTGYVHDLKYEEATHTLEFSVSAFFYSSTMKAKVDPHAEPPPKRIDSTLLTGPMKGFFYSVTFDPIANAKCEVAIKGDYRYETFPIHRLFLEFGLEAVFQGMAKRLRSFVEEQYRSGGAKSALSHNPIDNGA